MVSILGNTLKRNKVKCRYIRTSGNRILLGVEGTRTTYPLLHKELKKLKLEVISSVYGRWVLKYTGYEDLED